MITTVTASRRLVAALAAFMILAPVAPSGVFAAPGIAPGEAVTVASDSSALLRVEPGYGAEVVSEVAPGTWTSIVSGPYYDTEGLEWFEVDAGGFLPSSVLAYESTDSGYIDSAQEVSSEAVAEDASYEAPAEIAYEDPAAVDQGGYDPSAVIATAWIGGTGGEGAACRSDASFDGSELTAVWDGQEIGILGDPVGEWQPVSCDGMAGFVHASFISWEQPSSFTDSAAGANGQDSRDVIDEAPAVAPEAEAQQPEGDRASRRSDNGDTSRGREGGKGRGANAGGDGSSGTEAIEPTRGQAMVDFAMQYVGYPYVYAGEGPHAFDCSGFTMYVAREVLGMDITHDMFTQIELGTSVTHDELLPGDLVFFGDTFRPGLSHVGIYIGNGQFVHAENEDTGVRVSELDSDYYGSRWYGATRIW